MNAFKMSAMPVEMPHFAPACTRTAVALTASEYMRAPPSGERRSSGSRWS